MGRGKRTGGPDIFEEVSPLRAIDNRGPFDIIGDVHGCSRELIELLDKLGYRNTRASGCGKGVHTHTRASDSDKGVYIHPDGRQAVFLGDISDRGPDSVGSMRLVTAMVRHGSALYVPGNHCRKLYRYLSGRDVMLKHGIQTTAAELRALPPGERDWVSSGFRDLVENASAHVVLDDGRLVVAHAGIQDDMIGRTSKRITSFCLFGDTTGKRTEDGLPERRDWARAYDGEALIVYGHTPIREAIFRFNTINIDQGCVFGGQLTGLRYPERQLVHVSAEAKYDRSGVFSELAPEREGERAAEREHEPR